MGTKNSKREEDIRRIDHEDHYFSQNEITNAEQVDKVNKKCSFKKLLENSSIGQHQSGLYFRN